MAKLIEVGLIQINNSFANSNYFPYSIGVLQAYYQRYGLKPSEYQFLKPIYRRIPVPEAVSQLKPAAIAAFSVYVWNFQLSLAIARDLKKVNPNVLILFGGPHVPDKAELFLKSYPFIDIACHGEGENTFKGILDNFHSRNWGGINSISYLDNGSFVQNPRAPREQDLDHIPSPYLDGVFNSLIQSNPGHQWLGLWETNRGCPFSCAYCDWGSAVQAKMYTFDMGRLGREVEWFAQNRIEFIFCCDSNFGILKRDLEIVELMVAAKEKYGYPQAFSVQNTKNATERSYAIQKRLSDTGLSKGVNMALQTVDMTTLKNVGRQNISLNSFKELQKRFNADGVETFTDLILALPGETYESFIRGVDEIIDNGQHHRIQFINLSILPNARMGDPEYQNKYCFEIIKTKTINIHGSIEGSEDGIEETQELVVGTNTMPKKEWVKTRVFSWMAAFLYFDKIMQIPIILLHNQFGIRYSSFVEWFLSANSDQWPILSEITDFFQKEALKLQNGGTEYFPSAQWLNIYWPHDEYIFLKLSVENKWDQFYEEAEKLLFDFFNKVDQEIPDFLHEAIMINKHRLKQPFHDNDISLELSYNVWEVYQSALRGEKVDLVRSSVTYSIDRTSEHWSNWEDWFREVVWYGNKKGAYLYRAHVAPLKTETTKLT